MKKMKIRELVFMSNEDFWNSDEHLVSRKRIWFFFVNEVKELATIFSFFEISSVQLFFRTVLIRSFKRLSVESLKDIKGIELEDINRSSHLEHLEIGFDQQLGKSSSLRIPIDKQINKVPCLSLRYLEVLRIFRYCNQNGVKIDAPK